MKNERGQILPLFAILLIGLLWSILFPTAADAKGEEPLTSYVVVTGPGLVHPWVLHATGTAPNGYRGAAGPTLRQPRHEVGRPWRGLSSEADGSP